MTLVTLSISTFVVGLGKVRWLGSEKVIDEHQPDGSEKLIDEHQPDAINGNRQGWPLER